MPLEKVFHFGEGEVSLLGAAVQPFLPDASSRIEELLKAPHVRGDSKVGIVPHELLTKAFVLKVNRLVSVAFTPIIESLLSSAQPAGRRFEFHHREPLAALRPEEGESEEREGTLPPTIFWLVEVDQSRLLWMQR